MVAVDDCVYLCGGVTRDPFTGELCSMRDVSMFDIVMKGWTNCTDLQTARHNAGAAVIENFNVVIFSESTNSRGTKLGMLID
nr:hypothetical protein BaRGS_033120 [Batillaria attramentaria]